MSIHRKSGHQGRQLHVEAKCAPTKTRASGDGGGRDTWTWQTGIRNVSRRARAWKRKRTSSDDVVQPNLPPNDVNDAFFTSHVIDNTPCVCIRGCERERNASVHSPACRRRSSRPPIVHRLHFRKSRDDVAERTVRTRRIRRRLHVT